jgi:hypothetical protein
MPDNFVKHFCRNADGSWTCTSAATLVTARGRVQVTEGSRFYPGTVFMGVDLAEWLQAELGERSKSCG